MILNPQRCASNQVCQIEVPLETGAQRIWITNLTLDEASEESRLLQINSMLNRMEQLVLFPPPHSSLQYCKNLEQ
jgi:hypothetical protein